MMLFLMYAKSMQRYAEALFCSLATSPAPASFFNISSRVRQSSHENGDAHWAFFSKGVFIPFRQGGRLQDRLHTTSPSRTYVPDKNVYLVLRYRNKIFFTRSNTQESRLVHKAPMCPPTDSPPLFFSNQK